MKQSSKLVLLLVLWHGTLAALFAQTDGKLVKLEAQWVVQKDEETGVVGNRLNVRPLTLNGQLLTGSIVQGKPNLQLIRLVKQTGDTQQRLNLKLTKTEDALVRFEPDGVPEKDAKYLLFIESGTDGQPGIVLQQNGASLVYANPIVVRIADTATPFDRHREFGTKDGKFNPKGALAMLSGSGGGAIASGKFSMNLTDVFAESWLVQTNASADIALTPRDFAKSFNSVKADLSLVYINEDKLNWPLFGRGSRQFVVAGKFASDRAFETMDGALSLGAWLTMDNIITRTVSSALFIRGEEEHEPMPSLLWKLSYDWTGNMTTGSGNSERVTEVGENRILLRADWPLWIAREVDLTWTPLKSYYGIQLLIEEEATWDVENSQVLMTHKLTLDIMPDEPGHRFDPNYKKPSFTISYLNGKAQPTFRNTNEILAGIKIPW